MLIYNAAKTFIIETDRDHIELILKYLCESMCVWTGPGLTNDPRVHRRRKWLTEDQKSARKPEEVAPATREVALTL